MGELNKKFDIWIWSYGEGYTADIHLVIIGIKVVIKARSVYYLHVIHLTLS